MLLRLSNRRPTPDGVSKRVVALVDKLHDWRPAVYDCVHAARILPEAVETEVDKQYVISALSRQLDMGIRLKAAVRSTIPEIRLEEDEKRSLRLWLSIAAQIAISTIFVWLPDLLGLNPSVWRTLYLGIAASMLAMGLYAAIRGIVYGLRWRSEFRAACARSLGVMGDIRGIDALARHAMEEDVAVLFEVRKAIVRLAPEVVRHPDIHLSNETSQNLARILPETSTEIAENILCALIHAGSPSALTFVGDYRATGRDAINFALTDKTILVLQQRKEAARESSVLLRAAGHNPEHLLRPATPADETLQYLLHAVQPDDGG